MNNSSNFNGAAKLPKQQTKPFSIRLTAEERKFLEDRAGSKSIGAYVREQILTESHARRRSVRRVQVDDVLLGKVLAVLGQSRLSQNLNQIAKGLNMSSLPICEGVILDLRDACKDVRLMREALLVSLGHRPER